MTNLPIGIEPNVFRMESRVFGLELVPDSRQQSPNSSVNSIQRMPKGRVTF